MPNPPYAVHLGRMNATKAASFTHVYASERNALFRSKPWGEALEQFGNLLPSNSSHFAHVKKHALNIQKWHFIKRVHLIIKSTDRSHRDQIDVLKF